MHFFSQKYHTIWFFVLGLLVASVQVLLFYLEVPEASIFPLVLLAIWAAISYPVYFVIAISALVPLSIQLDDVGLGLGLALPTEPMMILFFALLLLRLVLNFSVDYAFLKHPIVVASILYLFWYFVTTLTSSMPVVSLKSFIAKCWFAGVFFFFLSQQLVNKKVINILLVATIAGATIMVLYTVLRHASEGFVRTHSYTIMRPFFSDHGIYAAFIAMYVPVLFVFVFYGKSLNFNRFWRFVFLGLLGLFVLGIVFSYTRATWLSIVAMIGFGVLVRYKVTFKQLLAFLILAITILSWQSERILYELSRNKQDSADRLENHIKSVGNISTDPSNMERINRWKCAVAMAKERPIFGFGPYTYTFQYAPFQRPEDLTIISTHAGTLGNAHSEYFMALSEMGFVGLGLLFALFMSSIYVGLKLFRESEILWVRNLSIGLILGLVTYYSHAFLNNYSEYDKIGVPLWSFLAILTALDLYHSEIKQTNKPIA